MITLSRFLLLIVAVALIGTVNIHAPWLIDGINKAKNAWFYIWVGILLIFFSIISYQSNLKFRFRLNRFDIILLILLLYSVLNSLYHQLILLSSENLGIFGFLTVYFLSKISFTNGNLPKKWLIIFLLCLTYTQALIAALQWFEMMPSFNNYFRISGFFFNPAPFAIYLSALLVFCLAQALFGHSRFTKINCLILLIVGLPIVAIIGSRAAWVALATAVFFVLELRFYFVQKLMKDTRLVTKILAAIVIITIALFVSNRLYDLKRDSADGRLLTWNLSLKIFNDNYAMGIGRSNFPATLLKYQSMYFQTHQERMLLQGNMVSETWFAFNDILQISVELGVLGITLMIALFIVFTKICCTTINSLIKNKNADSLIVGLLAMVMVILFSGLFSYPLMLLPFQILFCFSLGIISSNYDQLLNVRDECKKNSVLKSVICIITGVFYIWYGIHFYRGYSAWRFASKDYLTSYEIEKLELDYPFLLKDSWFLLAKGENYLENKMYSKAITILELAKKSCPSKHLYYLLGACYESEKNFYYAEQQYKFLKYSLPSLVRPRYQLAKLYYKSGQIAKWEKEALEIMNFKPRIESVLTQAMIEDIYDLWKSNYSLKNE